MGPACINCVKFNLGRKSQDCIKCMDEYLKTGIKTLYHDKKANSTKKDKKVPIENKDIPPYDSLEKHLRFFRIYWFCFWAITVLFIISILVFIIFNLQFLNSSH